jgi:hypothetical protein
MVAPDGASGLLDAMNAAYAALRKDPATWADELGERALWDGTLADGLDDHDVGV